MKQVIIIIRPSLYQKTKERLVQERFFSMSVKDVLGRGKRAIQFTSIEDEKVDEAYKDTMVAKKWIEVFVTDEDVDRLVKVVLDVNKNNKEGDGKIFIIPMDNCVRIHTGEIENQALI